MYDFLNAIGGMGFAILGAALTVGRLPFGRDSDLS